MMTRRVSTPVRCCVVRLVFASFGPFAFSYFLDNGQDGPYMLAPGPISKENWVEGPTAFRAGGDMVVLFDAYTRNRYEGVKSRDLKIWTPLTGQLEMPPGARHGTVFAMPEKVLKGLLAKK
jgi:hypothetical protein